jgi:hypothetical protein
MTTLGRVRGSGTTPRRWGARRLLAVLGVAAAATAPVVTASVVTASPASAVVWTSPCTATVHVDAQWGDTQDWAGSVLTVTVTNPASTAATTWTATSRMADGQSVGSIWNAVSIGSGVSLVARNDTGNGALAPGGSTTFGVYLRGGSQIPSFTCSSDAPRPVGDTVVTEADNGRTVAVVLGDTLTVDLAAQWRPPTLEGDAIELVSVTGGYPTGQPVHAVYRSRGSSTVTILRSQTDADCFHTAPLCARPVQSWSVTVQVLVPPPTG